MKKQLAAVLAAVLLTILPTPIRVMSAPKIIEEFFPTGEISVQTAPFLRYQGLSDDGDTIELWYNIPQDILALSAAYNRWGESDSDRD